MRLQKLTSAWFPVEGDPDQTEFHIKHLRSGEIKKVTSATQKQRFEFKADPQSAGDSDPKMIPVPVLDFDPVSSKEMETLESIIGWKNFYDSTGEILPYSEENKNTRLSKELSVEDYTDWLNFINGKRKILAKQVAEDEEKDKKN